MFVFLSFCFFAFSNYRSHTYGERKDIMPNIYSALGAHHKFGSFTNFKTIIIAFN